MSITLVVTSYNSTNYVRQFLSWVQKSRAFFSGIIIVDDCSDDGSIELIRTGLTEDIASGYVSLIALTENSGRPSIPRNCGISCVNTDYVLLLDIDDLLPRYYLEFLSLEAQSGVQCVYSGVKYSLSQAEDFDYLYRPEFNRRRRLSSASIKYKNQVTLSGAFLTREVAKRYTFPNQPLEDWLFWKDIVDNEPIPIYRLQDVPIGYSVAPTLSPKKSKQIMRVSAHLSKIGLLVYFAFTFRMKVEELFLSCRLASQSKNRFD